MISRSAEPRETFPSDALVLLIGPSGSGKSTWAAVHFEPGEVLSSDTYRSLIAGDEADQSATGEAFQLLHLVARARTQRGLRCVIDATNLTQRARRTLRHLAGDADRPVIAIAFDVSLERCLSQNDAREGRRVPDSVVHHHHAQMQEALAQLADEGYARVIVLHDADIEPD